MCALSALTLIVVIVSAAFAPPAEAHAAHAREKTAVAGPGGDILADPGGSHETDCCHKGGIGIACQTVQTDTPGISVLEIPVFSGICEWGEREGRLTGVYLSPPKPPPIPEIE